MNEQPEQRQGNTGIWTFVMVTPEGKIMATSAWGHNYEFAEKEWHALPVIEDTSVWFPKAP